MTEVIVFKCKNGSFGCPIPEEKRSLIESLLIFSTDRSSFSDFKKVVINFDYSIAFEDIKVIFSKLLPYHSARKSRLSYIEKRLPEISKRMKEILEKPEMEYYKYLSLDRMKDNLGMKTISLNDLYDMMSESDLEGCRGKLEALFYLYFEDSSPFTAQKFESKADECEAFVKDVIYNFGGSVESSKILDVISELEMDPVLKFQLEMYCRENFNYYKLKKEIALLTELKDLELEEKRLRRDETAPVITRVKPETVALFHIMTGDYPSDISIDFGDIPLKKLLECEESSVLGPHMEVIYNIFLQNLKMGDWEANMKILTYNMDVFKRILQLTSEDKDSFMDIMGINTKKLRHSFSRNWSTDFFLANS